MQSWFFISCRLLSVSAFIMLTSTVSWAQGPGSGGPAPTAPPTAVPLDGGASLLAAGGVAYGLKRLTRRQN